VDRAKGHALPLLKWLAFAAALAMFVRVVAATDLARVLATIARAGPAVLLGLVPYALAASLDALAFREVLALARRDVPFLSLLFTRVRAEALSVTLPGGAILAESVTPHWLRTMTSLPLGEGYAAVVSRKCFVGMAQAVYVLASFVLGFAILRARSAALVGGASLPWIVLGVAGFLFVLFSATSATVFFGVGFLPRRFARAESAFARAESVLIALRRSGVALVRPAALFLAAWLVESLETFLLLRLLGAPIRLGEVIAFEPSIALLRSLAFFAPAGVGVQDLGYVAVLHAFGIPDAAFVAPAFLLLKRSKELVWSGIGYASLLGDTTRLASPRSAAIR
jgi:hypothetical protein